MKDQLKNYIQDIVCRDYEYIFDYILQKNYKRYISIKKYRYKKIRLPDSPDVYSINLKD